MDKRKSFFTSSEDAIPRDAIIPENQKFERVLSIKTLPQINLQSGINKNPNKYAIVFRDSAYVKKVDNTNFSNPFNNEVTKERTQAVLMPGGYSRLTYLQNLVVQLNDHSYISIAFLLFHN